jgi:hypothetical protein
MSDKIQPQHLERKAVLSVRQSSAYQGVTGGKLRPGAIELVRSVPYHTMKGRIVSSYPAETSES